MFFFLILFHYEIKNILPTITANKSTIPLIKRSDNTKLNINVFVFVCNSFESIIAAIMIKLPTVPVIVTSEQITV